jgi:hypothetical protein
VDRAAELEPIDAGQHHIEHHQVGRLALHEPCDLAAVAGSDHAKTVASQVLAHDVADGRFVVDDEHGALPLHGVIVKARRLRSDEFGTPARRSPRRIALRSPDPRDPQSSTAASSPERLLNVR